MNIFKRIGDEYLLENTASPEVSFSEDIDVAPIDEEVIESIISAHEAMAIFQKSIETNEHIGVIYESAGDVFKKIVEAGKTILKKFTEIFNKIVDEIKYRFKMMDKYIMGLQLRKYKSGKLPHPVTMKYFDVGMFSRSFDHLEYRIVAASAMTYSTQVMNMIMKGTPATTAREMLHNSLYHDMFKILAAEGYNIKSTEDSDAFDFEDFKKFIDEKYKLEPVEKSVTNTKDILSQYNYVKDGYMKTKSVQSQNDAMRALMPILLKFQSFALKLTNPNDKSIVVQCMNALNNFFISYSKIVTYVVGKYRTVIFESFKYIRENYRALQTALAKGENPDEEKDGGK